MKREQSWDWTRGCSRVRSLGWRHDLDRHGPAGGVADSQLELPDLGVRLLLVVLTDLQKQFVLPRLERHFRDVLIKALAVVVLLAVVHLLAVDEQLRSVDAAVANLDGHLFFRFDHGVGVGHRVLDFADGLGQIDLANLFQVVFLRIDFDGERLPLDLDVALALICGPEVELRFGNC